jgi:hypothetical protein
VGVDRCPWLMRERKRGGERIRRNECSNLPSPLLGRVCGVVDMTTVPLHPLSPVAGCDAVSLEDRLCPQDL